MVITHQLFFFFSFIFIYVHTQSILNISNYEYPHPNEFPEDNFTIAILTTNDIHGVYFPINGNLQNGETFTQSGAEYLGKYINILRNEWKDQFLWLDAGDQFQGGLESKISNGSIMTDFLNVMGLNASTIGNHEFDYGQDFLRTRMENANYKYIVANLKDDYNRTEFLPNQIEVQIFTIGNVRIGVIGLTTITTVEKTSGDLTGIHFQEYKSIIIKHADILRNEQKVNAVIILGHTGLMCLNDGDAKMELTMRDKYTSQNDCNTDDEVYKILQSLPKGTIDAFIGGHKHGVSHHWIFDTPVVTNDKNGIYASVMYLHFDVKNNYALLKDKIQIESPLPICEKVFENTKRCDLPKDESTAGNLVNYSFHNVPIEKEEMLKNITETYWEEYQEYLQEILTHTQDIFEQTGESEQALGNLFCDFFRRITGAQISILNYGDFRTTWFPGNISAATLFAMSPFDNIIVSFDILGKDLRKMLYQAQNAECSFYPTSGLKQVGVSKPKKKLISVKLYDGKHEEEIQDDKVYKIATNDFLVPHNPNKLGGDDFAQITKWLKRTNIKQHGELRDQIKEFLKMMDELKANDFYDPLHPRLRLKN